LDHLEWDEILLKSQDFSFFHTLSWAKTLVESYGFRPLYFAWQRTGKLLFLMPFMEITSILTGKRGVSLPFTDFCHPFSALEISPEMAVKSVIDFGRANRWKYAEWHGLETFNEQAIPSESYLSHDVDLKKSEAQIFSSLRESNQRNIRKATRAGLTVRADSSLESLGNFYRLNCLTRRRHQLPPQPYAFFLNLYKHILSRAMGLVITVAHSGHVVASGIFFHFGKVATYKYGASDSRFFSFRPNNLVIWEAMRIYAQRGYERLDLGRTELDNLGLIQFKRMWGGNERLVHYYRYDLCQGCFIKKRVVNVKILHGLASRLPVFALRIVGRVLYRHMG
jgi:hypothetical protein